MAGLYIHIPYCRRKCIYCDFYSVGSARAPWASLTDALLDELRNRHNEVSETIDTLYIGGGTPSQMPIPELQRLIAGIRAELGSQFSPTESTIEANPEDITKEWIEGITDTGINRLSIGIQSLQDNELKNVGRRHTARQALDACDLASKHLDNISIDLMFGLPGQTIQTWQATLAKALTLQAQHISAYALMREPGTPLDIMLRQQRIDTPVDEVTAEMYRLLSEKLKDTGYLHYEISNYAKPGFQSKHNSSYWHSIPYLGLGPAAHSYDGQHTRRANRPDIKSYLEGTRAFDTETLTQQELLEEFVMTRLRTIEGISIPEAYRRLGKQAASLIEQRCQKYILHSDLLMQTSDGYALTEKGIMLSDSVISAIGFTE